MFVFVELDNGVQEFFDTPYAGFKYAKEAELRRRGSVEYVAIGEFYNDQDGTFYRGQELRYLLRSLDNVNAWLRTQMEAERHSADD
jgi:hypothetical protein